MQYVIGHNSLKTSSRNNEIYLVTRISYSKIIVISKITIYTTCLTLTFQYLTCILMSTQRYFNIHLSISREVIHLKKDNKNF